MEGFLICSGKRTSQPLFISETKINIFSVEELCFYIYENIETLNEKFFDLHLTEFLKNCDREDIAIKIETLVERNATMEELVRAVLSYVNYYGKDETEKLCAKVRSFQNQPVEERLKSVGDTLLKAKKYALAKKYYRRLIEMDISKYLDGEFCAEVWHNLGVVYARTLYFNAGLECFKKAYDICPNEKISISMQRALSLLEDNLSDESVQCGKSEAGECIELYNAGQMAKYNESVNSLISKWKKEYREQME